MLFEEGFDLVLVVRQLVRRHGDDVLYEVSGVEFENVTMCTHIYAHANYSCTRCGRRRVHPPSMFLSRA